MDVPETIPLTQSSHSRSGEHTVSITCYLSADNEVAVTQVRSMGEGVRLVWGLADSTAQNGGRKVRDRGRKSLVRIHMPYTPTDYTSCRNVSSFRYC